MEPPPGFGGVRRGEAPRWPPGPRGPLGPCEAMRLHGPHVRVCRMLAHVANRLFITLEGKDILGMAPEDLMLASMYKVHDPLAAEVG